MSTASFLLERVTEPDIEPLTVAQLKRHLRGYTSNTDEDTDLTDLIIGARQWVEQETSRALVEQQWRLTIGDNAYLDSLVSTPAGVIYGPSVYKNPSEIMLRRSPVLSIVSFVSVAADGAETAVDSSTYELRGADSKWPKIVGLNGATWWECGTYRIVFRAGYVNRTDSPQQDASVIPVCFKNAMKLQAEAIYDRDERMMEKLLEVATKLVAGERCNLDFA